ncbi:MAG: transcription-repair coupling factor [Candidatus Dormibacteria bacterium]
MPDTLLTRLDTTPGLAAALERRGVELGGVPTGAMAVLAVWLRERKRRRVLLVSADSEAHAADARLLGGDDRLGEWPSADTPGFDRVPPSEEVTRRRVRTLGLCSDDSPLLVVASPQGLLRPTLARVALADATLRIERGQHVDRDVLLHQLVAMGYRHVSAVSSAGDFAVRGGIVDVYGLDRSRPWRAEWFGDDVDEIRLFDVDTQVSVAKLDAVEIRPARELDLREENVRSALGYLEELDVGACRPDVREAWERDRAQLEMGTYDEGVDLFFPYLAGEDPPTLFDHLGDDVIVLCAGGGEALLRAARRNADELENLHRQEEARGELPAGAWNGTRSCEWLAERLVGGVALMRDALKEAAHDLGWRGVEALPGRFSASAAAMRREMEAGGTAIAVTRQQHRVEELCEEQGLPSGEIDELLTANLAPGTLRVVEGELSGGLLAPSLGVAIWTDQELFGIGKRRRSGLARGSRRALSTSARGARSAATGRAAAQAFTLEFSPGDVVVHRDHGIGRFVEMRKVDDDSGATHEYMILEYGDSDRLFVPVAHLDRVDRYVGGAGTTPTLSRLGTGEWERTKRRVKERTEEVARELIGLYSQREMAEGHAYGPDSDWQHELERSFAFEETPDQLMVLEEIKRDMEASKPMDRVVCGDVGFGKTELALRAAFKAITEGRQVAVLVPTTVLCQQHFLTFVERLRAFPLTVRQLSRFCSEEEARDTLLGLRMGTVDIVVGTHRLLQKGVEFKNLGLVVIDEEQRFGVLQKERFKQLRVAVDVLSLSATPIPRTLHMSLAGIRDLSVIQTPPEERQPIKTYVTAREDDLVREVITRELARGGQVFYVHNRVQSLQREGEWLRRLAPEAEVALAHGQMHEDLLAAVMNRFIEGGVDVLACTTIIESGLDIPNANTIVINDAHRLGLAQLYQLRGRVGRSGQRAYAYLLYPADKALTERADKRLEVIGELQDLGAGFKLAMRDLEIRGAGNLLGEEQHGEIASVGLELYNHLLRQAVTALQGKPLVEAPSQVTVALPIPAFLPAHYIDDETLRLRCYQELAACASESELDKSARGLVDRFGALPAETEALIASLRVRLLASAAGVTAVESARGGVVVQMPLAHGVDLESVARQYRAYVSSSPSRLYVIPPPGRRVDGEWQEMLMRVLRELGRLARVRERVPAGAAT